MSEPPTIIRRAMPPPSETPINYDPPKTIQ
jgi:hypothetical protein